MQKRKIYGRIQNPNGSYPTFFIRRIMTQEQLQNLLQFIKSTPNSSEGNEAAQTVLQLAAESITIDKLKDLTAPIEDTISSKSTPIKFTYKEISKMPKQFRTTFRTNKVTAHVQLRPDGVYVIRCQIDHVRYYAYSKKLEDAKQKFIAQLSTKNSTPQPTSRRILFLEYMEKWLETVKKPYVKESTYKDYLQIYKAYIAPQFAKRKLTDIKYFELQEYITAFENQGKNRTAKKVYQLLSALFDFAVADELINVSPMAKIKLSHYEQESGVPLTRKEEKYLLDSFAENPTIFKQAYIFIMYTGLRRSELQTVKVDNGWISVVTSKQRKGYKEKVRNIPISPMLKPYMDKIDIENITKLSTGLLTNKIKDIFPNHHLHDLRHTFITRVQECGIRREIASLWAGHKADSSITTTVYTHLEQNKQIQEQEMQKYLYEY